MIIVKAPYWSNDPDDVIRDWDRLAWDSRDWDNRDWENGGQVEDNYWDDEG